MKFQHYDLGELNGGEVVEITLHGNSANVKLMNSLNFQRYKRGTKHQYYGGHVTRSPYNISIPNYGRWYITIDLGGYSGNVKSSVRVL
ncbi:uncharacterized protein DUF1883 [Tenacibaculum adriaticum]|uniref:Uncharacterized protein DUF1883 n=1 Tax=Tenacibaculum adriaticum TaxID=413713 RepID=A0A5S5DW52_9FLAO|nr:DUF1883 domain-containing protein [Tenacibaculum adriaticum]TYP99012.1 uncharacterized protein DUF1883 [Tenacibaculum adriaticum]